MELSLIRINYTVQFPPDLNCINVLDALPNAAIKLSIASNTVKTIMYFEQSVLQNPSTTDPAPGTQLQLVYT